MAMSHEGLSWKDATDLGVARPASLPGSRTRWRIKFGIAAFDFVSLLAGYLIANVARFDDPLAAEGATLFALNYGLYMAYALNGGAYDPQIVLDRQRTLARSSIALTQAVATILFVAFFLRHSESMSRLAFAVGAGSGWALLLWSRTMFAHFFAPGFRAKLQATIVILDDMVCQTQEGVQIIDARAAGLDPDSQDPFKLDRIGRFLDGADRVIIACPEERRRRWSNVLKGLNLVGEIMTPEISPLGPLGISRYGHQSTMVVSTGPLSLRGRILKRALDLSVAAAVLLFIAPLLVLVAIAIKLDSRGPVLFVQQRVGRGNRLFNMYKFRSMRTEECDADGSRSTAHADRRITRIGGFIRATSIDELPQILNVLVGHMSLVGPRPHALGSRAEDKLFWEVDERYWHRHACKPGLTGLAQVRGFRGATLRRSDLTDRLQADLEYLSGWTIWRDISILFATIRVVIHPRAF
ncbi:exopolysaccharide biosynthesis polyprenyl glycosylphosphotransferase [Stakelama saccharophila]|uniref:Exopolysaccharide biosynthesis polyprenyl glycosylphosphotransferase n=1 Tax=Stakelama saccharophila TaxID=3075605 RepID=A0ABZ0BCN5_9SPHN|nr:exopolysaccharide biosynthesis polyprenyl glycosylphosphotransferase [Stakelama sp. W311]WNO55108.1 exopolysaccharide biosynthesis polyprenyl glycosylphosphotransferase [Stakelama sp. W311]